MDHWPLPLRQHAAIVALPRDVQSPDARRLVVDADLILHGHVDQGHGDNRILLRGGKVSKYTHMKRGAVFAIPLLHVLDEVVGDAGAVHARDVHRVPVILEPRVRVVKEPRVPRWVSRENCRRVNARHRSRRGLEDGVRDAAGFVGNEKYVLAVYTRKRLWLLRARRPDGNKRAFGVALQLNAVRLDLQQIVKRGLEPLGHVFHLRETRVKELRGRGGRDHRLARDAHQDVPDGRHGDCRRLADTVARANSDAADRGGCDGVEQLLLPLVRRDADDLAGEGHGVAVVAAHEREERVVVCLCHVNTSYRGGVGNFFSGMRGMDLRICTPAVFARGGANAASRQNAASRREI